MAYLTTPPLRSLFLITFSSLCISASKDEPIAEEDWEAIRGEAKTAEETNHYLKD